MIGRIALRCGVALLGTLAVSACGDRAGSSSSTTDAGRDAGNLRVELDASGPVTGETDAAHDAAVDADMWAGECRTDADCSDGFFCNGIERCFEGTCFESPTPQCSDPSECTDDLCDETNQRCEFVPNDDACAPGQVCTSKAGCFTPAGCAIDADCDDGLMCNGEETCVAGQCEPGTALVCDDGVECTADSCVEGEGCQTVADHQRCLATELCGLIAGCTARPPCMRNDDCDDGMFCNGRETCSDGVCIPGEAPVVPDAVNCTIDQCSESLDMVRHTPDNARCSDAQFCNGAEVCHPTDGCGPGTPPSSSDGVGCTVDTCNEMLDVIEHAPDDAACDDGAFCNGTEVCHPNDDCQPGEPPLVNDGIGCTIDSCSEVRDEIVHVPDDTRCDDTLFCNGAEVCDPLLDCQNGTPPVVDDGIDCTTDSCDESNDVVRHQPVDSVCDDGQFCTGPETCNPAMGCISTPPTIDDGIACTADSCDEANDRVVHAPNDSVCDDNQFCNGAEFCDPNLDCQSGAAPETNDGVGCTIDSCDEANDVVVHTPDDSLCDNNLYCDGVETCSASTDCVDGPDPDVSDNDPCTVDTCDEASDGSTHTPSTDGTVCSNGPRSICRTGSCQASTCGDGFVDTGAGEQCDHGGTPNASCDAACQTVAGCDPDGTWTLDSPVAYECCFGNVNVSVTSFIFSDDGATVRGSPSNPETMTGAAAQCPSGTFDVQSSIIGGCTETYTLSGSFDDANNWSGTYEMTFTGSECSCYDGIFGGEPCVNQVFPISASR